MLLYTVTWIPTYFLNSSVLLIGWLPGGSALVLLLLLTVPFGKDQRKELFPWFLSTDYSDSSTEWLAQYKCANTLASNTAKPLFKKMS